MATATFRNLGLVQRLSCRLPRSGLMRRSLHQTPKASSAGNLSDDTVYENVQDYYGRVLQNSKDLKTSACTAAGRPPQGIIDAIGMVPEEVTSKFYGCGNPIPAGLEGRGLSVLDLGSGSGQDCYVAANLVGPEGFVTGIDMTESQLETARSNADAYCKDVLGYPQTNMKFVQGHIEYLGKAGIEPESVDIVVSNCVINLSPDKEKVIQGVYDSLRTGGELYFSDVYADRRLSDEVREHEVLFGECLGGALYVEDFIRICHKVGFADPRELSRDVIEVTDPELAELVGDTTFYSITYRAFKVPGLESLCEDYGQIAYYKGTIAGHRHVYALDDHHVFETGRPMLVCGNTAAMVGDSWLAPHFEVVGDTSHHFGLFDCSTPAPAAAASASAAPAAAGGSCC